MRSQQAGEPLRYFRDREYNLEQLTAEIADRDRVGEAGAAISGLARMYKLLTFACLKNLT
jgi:hypothetical protein